MISPRILPRLLLAALVIGSIGLIAASVFAPEEAAELPQNMTAPLPTAAIDVGDFARAIGPYAWSFPADYGAHPAFQTEWWYYTGNLAAADGRRFGYQFTIFRRALTPVEPGSESEWRTNQIYMAHFTVTDVANEAFYQAQRFSRGGLVLAGATSEPRYRVWLENWQISASDEDAIVTAIEARDGPVAIDLALEQLKPPALQGDVGLSPKSDEPGNASYYFSLTRLRTTGTITIADEAFDVEGASWMDHEFSTSALGPNAQGWDWFGLHLDDDRELMLGQIRLQDGGVEPAFEGLLVEPDGSTRVLPADSFTIEPTASWTSPHSDTTYPAGWHITVEVPGSEPLTLDLAPLVADQELREGIVYWEGAVGITGDATGYGYAELTGYHEAMRGRF